MQKAGSKAMGVAGLACASVTNVNVWHVFQQVDCNVPQEQTNRLFWKCSSLYIHCNDAYMHPSTKATMRNIIPLLLKKIINNK